MEAACGGILSAAQPDRKARRTLSRRSGQNGWIEQRKGSFYGRFWMDVAGQEKRVCKRVRICPATGPGSLNASERSRRLKQILAASGANSEQVFREAEAANLGITFKEQSGAAQRVGLGFTLPELRPVAPTVSSDKSFRIGRGERI